MTPLRAGRVIFEIGGKCDFEELTFLPRVCRRLPFDCMPISYELMNKLKAEEDEMKAKNVNPYTYEKVVRLNMDDCHRYISEYDKQWFGKYI